jgi:hypothetical protein
MTVGKSSWNDPFPKSQVMEYGPMNFGNSFQANPFSKVMFFKER